MNSVLETVKVGRKKQSEVRKHEAMVRVGTHALERAKLAAHMMGKTLGDWTTETLEKQAEVDIQREATKLANPTVKPKR